MAARKRSNKIVIEVDSETLFTCLTIPQADQDWRLRPVLWDIQQMFGKIREKKISSVRGIANKVVLNSRRA